MFPEEDGEGVTRESLATARATAIATHHNRSERGDSTHKSQHKYTENKIACIDGQAAAESPSGVK